MTQRTAHPTDSFPWFPLTTVALTGVLWILHLALRDRYEPGDPTRLGVTAALVVGFALTIWLQVRLLAGSLDEYQRQVQLTALAFAFPVSLVATFTIGYLGGEGLLRGADSRDLPTVMLLAYGIGRLIAWRRYR